MAHRLVTELNLERAVMDSVERLLSKSDEQGDFGLRRHTLSRARVALQGNRAIWRERHGRRSLSAVQSDCCCV